MPLDCMKTITATYRVVTPMFLGGAEPTADAELRLPSFKGALRFWWRALMWGKVQDLKELRCEEAKLFGSSETGQSKALMRLDEPLIEANVIQQRWSPNSCECYTGYGIQDPVRGDRRFIAPGREFSVHLDVRRCSKEQVALLISALKVLGLVGGLGFHSRKGWGSVTLTRLKGAEWTCPNDRTEWAELVEALADGRAQGRPRWTAFSTMFRCAAGPKQPNADKAQQWLGKRYQRQVKATLPKEHRAQFGLPRAFKPIPRGERRASPLFLHVHQCPDGQAVPCAIWLPSDFLPNETEIPGKGEAAQEFLGSLSGQTSSGNQ